ncbi:MAG: VOC family protein [Burkholderiaceae bacterium]|nr:VOC family protein [Burkholderiaceae bacterium]
MLDHMTFRVSDIAASKTLYEQALSPLGYRLAYDGVHDGQRVLGFGVQTAEGLKIDTWLVNQKEPVTTACHLCWRADSTSQVDAFYKAALAAGGRCNGAPGLRAHYHPNYYGAFVLDLDGNNIEAVCHTAEAETVASAH